MKNGSKTAKIDDFISIFMLNGGFFLCLCVGPPCTLQGTRSTGLLCVFSSVVNFARTEVSVFCLLRTSATKSSGLIGKPFDFTLLERLGDVKKTRKYDKS